MGDVLRTDLLPDTPMRAALLPPLAVAGLLMTPGVGEAGGTPAVNCNCAPPPPACCGIASSHTITVPGVNVIPPSIYVAPPRITGGVSGEAGVAGDISVSVQASSSSSAYASSSAAASALASATSYSAATGQGYGSALATANSQAANLLAASAAGASGGSSFFNEGATGGNIPSLIVSTPGAGATTRQVCARTAAASSAVALQAVCLDDKAVPHPASQVMPGRDVAQTYAGELFRCIAGAHMQYVVAPFAGEARFDHGQTVVCGKGESLWRDLGGRLQCRPQTPARDCNERSLLRRYGAGIKILKAAMAEQCVEWRTEAVQAEAASQGGMALDGGVGG